MANQSTLLFLSLLFVLTAGSNATTEEGRELLRAEGIWSDNFNLETAVIGGFEPSAGIAYVCRAITTKGEITVGKYYVAHKACFFADGTTDSKVPSRGIYTYQYLLSDSASKTYAWMVSANGSVVENAIKGGVTAENETTFICRGMYSNPDSEGTKALFLPGTLIPNKATCTTFYYGVKELSNYDILVDLDCGVDSKSTQPSTYHTISDAVIQAMFLKSSVSKGIWSKNLALDKAVVGGFELGDGGTAYVCRVSQNGEVIPGKYVTHDDGCFIPNGSSEDLVNPKEILFNPGAVYAWVPKSTGQIEYGAVEGGVLGSNEQTFVCRAMYHDSLRKKVVLLPGNLVPSEGICYVPYGGVQKMENYEVLVDTRNSCGSKKTGDPTVGFQQAHDELANLTHAVIMRLGRMEDQYRTLRKDFSEMQSKLEAESAILHQNNAGLSEKVARLANTIQKISSSDVKADNEITTSCPSF